MVQALVLYSLAEHQLGHASSIRVSASGRSFSVGDNGRGHTIGRSVDASPYLNFIYAHLDYPFQARESKPIQLQGLGMSLLNRLCAELNVSVRKRNETLTMLFRHGNLVRHELLDAENESTGIEISGHVETRIAGQLVDEQALYRWLQNVLEASPSLRLSFNGQPLELPTGGA